MNENFHKFLITEFNVNKYMNRNKLLLLIFSLVTLLCLSQAYSTLIATVTIKNLGKVTIISSLHVEERYIKNALGQTVVLRGVNKAGFEDFPDGWWNPEGGGLYSGAGVWNEMNVLYNLGKIKEWGANVVRFHHSMDFWVRQDLYPTFRQRVRRVTELAGELGLYVIWDPYSVIKGGGQPSLPWYPHVSNETKSNLGYSEKDIMPNSTAFVEYWREWAEWLKDYPNVLFELVNEPKNVNIEPYHWGRSPSDPAWQEYASVINQTIQAIRSTGATQPIIVTGHVDVWCDLDHGGINEAYTGSDVWWVTQVQEDGATPIIDPLNNIIYCTHQYRASSGLGEHDNGTRGWTYSDVMLAMNYTKILDVINTWNKPLILTECGPHLWHTDEELIREIEGLSNQLRIYNQYGISYVVWVWTVPEHMPGGIVALTDGKWYCEPNVGGRVVKEHLSAPVGQDNPIYIHPTIQYAGTKADYKNIQYRATGKPHLTTWITNNPTRTLVKNIDFDESRKVMNIMLYSITLNPQIIEIICATYGEPPNIINATKVSYDLETSKLKINVSFNSSEILVTLSWAT